MNELTISQREWKITDLVSKEEDENDNRDKFDRSKSVFKNFKEDTDEILRKMFELDFSYSKIPRIIKNND